MRVFVCRLSQVFSALTGMLLLAVVLLAHG